MKRIYLISALTLSVAGAFTGCDTLKKLPTNTSGGVFSLNGNWTLIATNDNNAEMGTTITVLPIVGSGSVKTLANNTYCYRENDVVWKDIKTIPSGGFSLSQLAGACNGTTTYNEGTITIENNNLVKINSKTVAGIILVQEWKRASN